MTNSGSVEDYYTRPHLFETVLAALKENGVEEQAITWKELAPLDEFHVRGVEVTNELAAAAGFREGMQVLDVGCGIGGPCRLLAAEYGCFLTGIDITTEFIRAATQLSELAGLGNKTRFMQGDALNLPFDDESFDMVWTQHAQMNIEDKQKFYSEIGRVLKKNGRFIYYDIFSNSHQPVIYPTPWASDASQSFLCTVKELKQFLREAGLRQINTIDQTRNGIDFFKSMFSKINPAGPSTIGLRLFMGDTAKERLGNVLKNLEAGIIVLESGICEKPAN